MRVEHIKLTLGTTEGEKEARHDFGFNGKIKHLAFYPDTATLPATPVFLSIKDESGNTLVEALPQQAFHERQGGDFFQSKFPCNFDTTRIRVNLFGEATRASAFSGTLVFFGIENK